MFTVKVCKFLDHKKEGGKQFHEMTMYECEQVRQIQENQKTTICGYNNNLRDLVFMAGFYWNNDDEKCPPCASTYKKSTEPAEKYDIYITSIIVENKLGKTTQIFK